MNWTQLYNMVITIIGKDELYYSPNLNIQIIQSSIIINFKNNWNNLKIEFHHSNNHKYDKQPISVEVSNNDVIWEYNNMNREIHDYYLEFILPQIREYKLKQLV